MHEQFPSLDSPNFLEWETPELHLLIADDLKEIHTDREMQSISRHLPELRQVSMYQILDKDLWAGYIIELPEQDIRDGHPATLNLHKVKRVSLETVESKQLVLDGSYKTERRRRELFVDFDQEELAHIAACLYAYKQSIFESHSQPDIYMLLETSEPQTKEVSSQESRTKASQPVPLDVGSDKVIQDFVLEAAAKRLNEDHEIDSRLPLLQSLHLLLKLQRSVYVAELTRSTESDIEGIAFVCFEDGQAVDTMAISIGEDGRQTLDKEPENHLRWSQHLFHDVFTSGQKVQEAAQLKASLDY